MPRPTDNMREAGASPEVIEAVQAALDYCLLNVSKGENGYAITYLRGIPRVIAESYIYGSSKEDALRVQLLYVLNNLSAWRGPDAAKYKTILREFTRRKQ